MLIGIGLHAGQDAIKSTDARLLLDFGGFDTFRDEVYWSNVEQTEGTFAVPYNTAASDRLFRDVQGGLMVLDYGNTIYGGGFPTTKRARTAFCQYAEWAARRYGPSVWGFEVWNEAYVSGLGNSGTPVDAVDYVALCAAVYPVIRQYAPNAKIVVGAVTGLFDASDWIEETLQLGIAAYCDVYSVHPYVWAFGSGAHAAHAYSWVDEVRGLLTTYAPNNTPTMAVTEIGWPNHTGTNSTTEAKTAGYVVQSFALGAARSWIDGVWWYEMQNQGTDVNATEDNYGLVRADMSSKPAMLALRDVAPLFGAGTLVGGGVLATNRHWYTFSMPDGDEFTVAWVAAISGSASFTIASSDSFASAELVYGTDPTFTGSSITPTIGEDPLVFRHAAGTVTVS